MKRTIYILLAVFTLCSCQADLGKEKEFEKNKGVPMTVSATVSQGATRTTYNYVSGTKAGTIDVSWEATEKMTMISMNDGGITAIDEFTSTGTAGRTKADFTGTWNGGEGDKVICIYPSITTTEGAALFSGVALNATSIGLNFAAATPSTDINKIKACEVMVGNVNMSATSASVQLHHEMCVLRLGVSGAYPWDGDYGYYITQLGISATNSSSTAKLFATHAVMNTTRLTCSASFTPDTYQSVYRKAITQQSNEGTYYYYIPLLANGTLEIGDKLTIAYGTKERSGGGKWETDNTKSKTKTLESPLSFSPGYVYQITVEL